MKDFVPDEQFKPDEVRAPAAQAIPAATSGDFIPDSAFISDEEKYGTLGQQALAALEGAASSATFGLSTGIQTKLGLATPEDIRGRREENPIAYGAGQVAGLLVPGSLAGKAITGVGKGAAALVSGAAGASTAAKIGATGAGFAAEGALFQAGDEISKMFADPDRTVGTALGDIGAATLVGGVLGAGVGAVSPLWNATVGGRISKAISDFKRGAVDPSIEAAAGLAPGEQSIVAGLKQQKPNAKEIIEAAKELNAPVLESQLSASKHIQNIDSMLSQSPSPTGVARQQMIKQGFDAAENAVKTVIGEAPVLSEAETGSLLRGSISKRLEAEYAPVSKMYEMVRQSTPHIPVSEASLKAISRNIMNLEEVALSKTGPAAGIAKRVVQDLPGLKSVDQIKQYKTLLYDSLAPGASRAEKNAVNAIAEKLSNLEANTIVRQAEKMAAETADPAVKQQVLELIGQRKAADAGYKALMEKSSDLAEMLGKKRIRGFSQFQEFLEEGLSAEKIAKRLFAKGDSAALAKFAKNFPEEAKLVFDQQKAALRDAAFQDGRLNTGKILRELDKLPKEVREMMFSPEELKKLGAAQTYLEAMPKNINPSGTAITEEFYRFYGSPLSAGRASLRDFALNKLMTSVVKKGEEEAFYKSVFPAIAEQVAKGETSPSALKAAVDYGMSVVRGERRLFKATRAVLYPNRESAPKYKETSEKEREKLDKRLKEIEKDPAQLMASTGDVGHYLPEHAAAIAAQAAQAANYLNSLRPKQETTLPLDKKTPVDPVKKAQYDRALDIAQDPMIVLESVKKGTVTVHDIVTLKNVAGGLYGAMKEKLTNELINRVADEEPIPYHTRMGLALFLGQPLDSTMTPEGIQAAQPKGPMAPQPQQAAQGGVKPTATGMQNLKKLGPSFATGSQAREMSRTKNLA